MSENKISEEVAKQQLDDLFEYYEIEIDQDDEERVDFIGKVSAILIQAIQKGRVEITVGDSIEVKQHLKNGELIEYKEISGAAKIEMDKASKRGDHAKLYSLLGYLSTKGESVISKFKGRDSTIAEALAGIFLAV